MKKYWFLTCALLLTATGIFAQSALDIVRKSDEKLRGQTSYSEMKMTIVRPDWKREIQLKSWTKGDDLALMLVTAPARDKGTAFLKRGQELWNWQPTIDRTIKMPPSMMLQSWMGSDFTNDDLVKQSSIVEDYTHKIVGEETIEGRPCWKIEMTPKPDAPVVWGKLILWIDKTEFMQIKGEFYDEDGYLVNTMTGKNVKDLGGKMLPAILEIAPEDKPGQKTVVEYLTLKFDQKMDDGFFSVQSMKRVK